MDDNPDELIAGSVFLSNLSQCTAHVGSFLLLQAFQAACTVTERIAPAVPCDHIEIQHLM